jgi:hypothetical protein
MAGEATPTSERERPTLGWAGGPGPGPLLGRFGDYELLAEIGRGGMGVVFRAYEPALGRFVALKMMQPGALPDENDVRRFQREAASAAKLRHPHIVTVHRVGVQDGRHFFSMDLIEGPSLSQRLASGPLPGKVAARYVAAVARAIHHAHQQGILHRDIKPGNVLIDAHDVPHVTDFGLAKQLSAPSEHTRTGAVLGTPSYMAPEQANGQKDLGPACDVYGLGALLYELLTGRPPFRAETTLDTLLQVMQNEPAPPRLLSPGLDRDLETICLKCLHKAPADRYSSAAELADDLERYLNGEPIRARSVNLLARVARALERSQHDVEFGQYSTVLYWFAGIVAVLHVVKHFLVVSHQPTPAVLLAQFVQFGSMVFVLWLYRPKGLLPTTTAERQLWSVWVGYVLTCSLVSAVSVGLFGLPRAYDGILYPYYALVTGLAFFVLGSSYWGRCYVFALAFWALALLMLLDMRWVMLEFGGLWTLTLFVLGRRLRRLAKG